MCRRIHSAVLMNKHDALIALHDQRRAAFAGNLASRQPMIPEGDERAVYGAAQPRARPDGVGALNLGRLNRPMSARP